jgi:hypothetical protein
MPGTSGPSEGAEVLEEGRPGWRGSGRLRACRRRSGERRRRCDARWAPQAADGDGGALWRVWGRETRKRFDEEDEGGAEAFGAGAFAGEFAGDLAPALAFVAEEGVVGEEASWKWISLKWCSPVEARMDRADGHALGGFQCRRGTGWCRPGGPPGGCRRSGRRGSCSGPGGPGWSRAWCR